MNSNPTPLSFLARLAVTVVAGLASGCSMLPVDVTTIKPAPLEPGDTIMFVAPAGELDRERMMRAKERLEAMGFRVKHRDDLFRQFGYLAGTDDQRAAELMAAFEDPEVDAVFPGTGGYGVTRILDRLDYDVIRRNPKILIGFSDITGLHLAIGRRAGLVTFHSPNPMWGLGSEGDLTEFSARYFWRALLAKRYVDRDGERLPSGWTYEVPPDIEQPQVLVAGTGRGRLVGGNFSLIAATMGTPYEVDTRGAILFLEDVSEAPYRIDRYLSTLKLAGKLDELQGVILGKFTRTRRRGAGPSKFTIERVFDMYFGDADYPVISEFPAGHFEHNATLPLGAMFELEADAAGCRVTLLEDPVDLGR